MKEKKRTQPNCTKCSVAEGEITVLKAKVDSLSEVEENYDVARRMYVEKEKELQKSNELHSKDLEKEGLDRLKLEDTVRRLTLENERLKAKDNTYFNIYIYQFLDSKGFKISKIGEIHEENQSKEMDDDVRKEKETDGRAVKFVCEECDQEMNSKEILDAHKNTVHKTIFACTICDFNVT